MAYLDDLYFTLNIQPSANVPLFVRLSQNENGRRLYFALAGAENTIPSGTVVTITGTKPDGVVYSKTGSITNNVVLINEDVQMTAVAGTWYAKIKLVSGGQTIASARIRFVIDADTVDPEAVPSNSQLEGLIAEAQYYAEEARVESFGSPLVASTAAGMTDHTRVYVYTGSETGYTAGHWYYWNGSAWTDGGVYNSVAVNTDTTLSLTGVAADAKSVGDGLANLKSDLNCVPIAKIDGGYIALNGSTADVTNPTAYSSYSYSLVSCKQGDTFTVNAKGGSAPRAWGFVSSTGTVLLVAPSNHIASNVSITAPADTAYLVINDNGGYTSYYGDLLKNKVKKICNVIENENTKGYQMIDFGDIETKKLLNAYGYIVGGTDNNFIFTKYIRIPTGNIYFCMKNGYQSRVIFYDDNFRMIDRLSDGNWIPSLTGTVYNNTSAAYMGISAYQSGGPDGTDFCYAYAYTPESVEDYLNYIVPLWENKDESGTVDIYSVSTTGYIKSDLPVIIHPAGTGYVFNVTIYDDTYTQINRYNASSIVSIPSGIKFRVSATKSDESQISAKEVLENIIIEKKHDNLGLFTLSRTAKHLTATNARVGNIDIKYTDVPLILSCDDTSLYRYILGLYNGYDNNPVCLYQYDNHKNMLIPANSYYRIVVGRSNNAAIPLSDMAVIMAHIKLIPVSGNSKEVTASIKATGFVRQQFDTDIIPSYYESHISGKIVDIMALKEDCEVQFAFITDYHYGTYQNTHTARPLLTEIAKKTNVNIFVNGGDVWTNRMNPLAYGDAKQRFIAGMEETIPNAPCEYYYLFGNHDTGVQTNGTTYTDPTFDAEEFNEICIGNFTGRNIIYNPATDYPNYYFDVNNIRFIAVNPQGTNVHWPHESEKNMCEFLCDALLSAGNRTIIIISHVYYWGDETVSTQALVLANAIVAYNARQTYSGPETSGYSIVSNFSNCAGKVACWIAGHRHKDAVTALSDGTPVVIVTTCNAGAEMGDVSRTAGTITENAFDVVSVDTQNKTIYFTRIGAGEDREVTYS